VFFAVGWLANVGHLALDIAGVRTDPGVVPVDDYLRTSAGEISSFIVENVSLPPEVEAAIDKRSSMAAVGNLNDYVKFQMAESMTKGGGEAGAMAGTAAGLGAGLAMGQQMVAAMNTAQTTPPAAPTGAAPPVISGAAAGATVSLLGSGEVAQILGVSEADVLATLEKGDLKGKKIGSTWRVTKAALDEFLKS
jgi:excisionase family DNA binding protein